MEDFDIFHYDNGNADDTVAITMFSGEEICFDKIIAIMCFSGSGNIYMSGVQNSIIPDSFTVIAPGIPFRIDASNGITADILLTSADILFINGIPQGSNMLKRLYLEKSCCSIPEYKLGICRSILNYLRILKSETHNLFRAPIIRSYVNIFFYEASNILINEDTGSYPTTKSRNTCARFIAEVEHNFRTMRKVKDYSEKMNLCSKRLSAIVKQESGRTASEWIEFCTLYHAKKMLVSGEMSIQEISYDLSFSTPSHFSSFFRKHTGMTPKEFIRTSVTSHNEASHLE